MIGMDDLRGVIDALNDPQMRHAAIVHFPIVLSVIGLILAIASLAFRGNNNSLRWTTFAAFVLLAGMSYIGVRSGENAESQLGDVPDAVHELIEEHESLAERAWLFGAAAAGLMLLAAVPRPAVRITSSMLAVMVGVGGAGWLATTAHHGGQLVYDHGIGGPPPPEPTTIDTPAGDEHESAKDQAMNPDSEPGDLHAAFFLEHVRPILAESCFRCHNPRRRHRSGDLDQTSREGLLVGGGSGPAIVPGDPDGSLLIRAIEWTDDDFQMPPDDDQLPDDAIQVLRQWILDGAAWVDVPVEPPPAPSQG